jgi:hypothetical protein
VSNRQAAIIVCSTCVTNQHQVPAAPFLMLPAT